MTAETELTERVANTLARCLDWSQAGRHRKVLTEVERTLPEVEKHDHLTAHLLIWKAQALLSMGCADRALAAASRSWELESTPHACHLLSNALHAVGDADQAEDMLEMGRKVFPRSVHLQLQLAMLLSDQGRLPEALAVIESCDPEADGSDEMQTFILGMQANLLATMGRWSAADSTLRDGLEQHPESTLLLEAHESINHAWARNRAEQALVDSWQHGLQSISGVSAEVDEAVVHFGAVVELPKLSVLAARRLWRAYSSAVSPRIVAPDPWAVASLLAAAEVDGGRPAAAAMARATRTRPSTVRSILRKLRIFLDGFDAEFRKRAFGAFSNPMLEAQPAAKSLDTPLGQVVQFPGKGNGKGKP